MRVRDILEAKGHEVTTVLPQASLDVALHMLTLENIGALVVSSDGKTIDGLLSERDVCRRLASGGAATLEASVRDLMTRPVVTCTPDALLKDVMATMTRRRVRHLPVVQDGAVTGIVSIGDVVKHRLGEIEMERNVLRDMYVARS